MSQLKVLIVGASIAGPTAAYWFSRAGASVTVIERFPHLRNGGQGIDIRTTGVSVMRKIPGMEAAVRAKTTQMDGISFVREDGTPYGTIKATGDPDQQSLVSEYEIFRGDLARILYDMTKDDKNIKYVFNEQVSSIQQESENPDHPITVSFANGKLPTTTYDLVVACDGSTSRTRAIGLNCGVRDHIHPTNCWAAYCTIPHDLLHGSKIGQAYSSPGGRFIAIGPDPAGATRVGIMSLHPQSDRDATLPFREAMKKSRDDDNSALKAFVVQRYADVGWTGTAEILQGIRDSKGDDSFYGSEVVQVKVPQLSNGRFVLVGDAGYAPGFTGTGTSLALTGAYVLAGEIASHKGDITAGLKGYEDRMRPLIKEMQKVPPLIPTIFAPQTPWGLWLRNTIFAFIAWTRILEFAQRYFGGSSASGAGKYGLPDYEWVP